MTTKRPYTPRVPAINCPHCDSRAIARDSKQLDPLTRNIRFVCDNPDCGHVFMAQIGIYRTIRPSEIPNPSIVLPFGQWRSKPANDNDPQSDATHRTAGVSLNPG